MQVKISEFIPEKELETVKETPLHKRHWVPVDNPRKQNKTNKTVI